MGMKSWEYRAVTTEDGSVYCVTCVPKTQEQNVYPIFADTEWDSYPVCDACRREHDYVVLINAPIPPKRSTLAVYRAMGVEWGQELQEAGHLGEPGTPV